MFRVELLLGLSDAWGGEVGVLAFGATEVDPIGPLEEA